MRYRLLKALALLFAVSLAACGDDDPAAPQVTRLRVQNNSSVIIEEVYFSACTDQSWGNDRLGTGEVINAGANRQWDITPGCWDVLLSTSVTDTEFTGLNIAAGQTHVVTLTN